MEWKLLQLTYVKTQEGFASSCPFSYYFFVLILTIDKRYKPYTHAHTLSLTMRSSALMK